MENESRWIFFFTFASATLGIKLPTTTCTGLAATKRPATPPPTTRPSGLASETLIPPDLLRAPPLSVGMKDPERESNSNRPSYVKVPPDESGCRRVTLEIAPLAERMHMA